MRAPLNIKTDYINVLLDQVAQRTRALGDRAYERLLGMPLRDVRALRMIGVQPGISMGELAEDFGLEKTLASKVIRSLVDRDLVARVVGKKDGRNIHLYLTDKGVDVVEKADPVGRKLEANFLSLLGNTDIAPMRDILQKALAAEQLARGQFDGWLEEVSKQVALTVSQDVQECRSELRA